MTRRGRLPINHLSKAERRLQLVQGQDPRHALAITAALEHFTAMLAHWLLRNPGGLGSEDPRLATLWLWHSAEESEHRSTAFDLYQALGGNYEWRVTWFRRITRLFLLDLARQTMNNLWRDGSWRQWSTWRNGAGLLLGRHGLIRTLRGPWRDYLRRDFHPSQQDASESRHWLAAHRDQYSPVGSANEAAVSSCGQV